MTPLSVIEVTFLTDLEDFLNSHRPHGSLTADATEPAWNGYLLTVSCSCGVVFERWVTPESAESDLRLLALRNWFVRIVTWNMGCSPFGSSTIPRCAG